MTQYDKQPSETDAQWHRRLDEAAARLMGYSQLMFWDNRDGTFSPWQPTSRIEQAWMVQGQVCRERLTAALSQLQPLDETSFGEQVWLATAPPLARVRAALEAMS